MALSHLLVMRHAKSSWKFENLSDHARPLNSRGRRAAKVVGDVLRGRSLMPDDIWSSDSKRTRETAAFLCGDTSGPDIRFFRDFYHALADAVLYYCAGHGEPDGDRLMLLGHNPGWEGLVVHFARHHHRMPTGACAVFTRTDTEADWLSPEAWMLADLILPKEWAD